MQSLAKDSLLAAAKVERTCPATPSTGLLLAGFLAVYVVWGSTYLVLFDWLRPQGVRPRWSVFAGLAVGFVGVAILARGEITGLTKAWGLMALVTASMSWAFGSLFSRRARKPDSAFLAVAMQLIAGGSMMLALGLACGEATTFSFARINTRSALSWGYLSLAGSVVGFTAYIWLLQVSTPARVGTYAFVNPLIAVLLGWAIGHEPISRDLLMAAGLIVLAVALIIRSDSLTTAVQWKFVSKNLCR